MIAVASMITSCFRCGAVVACENKVDAKIFWNEEEGCCGGRQKNDALYRVSYMQPTNRLLNTRSLQAQEPQTIHWWFSNNFFFFCKQIRHRASLHLQKLHLWIEWPLTSINAYVFDRLLVTINLFLRTFFCPSRDLGVYVAKARYEFYSFWQRCIL